MVRRHVRHQRKSQTRAQMLAANMRKRAPKPEPEPTEAPDIPTPDPVSPDQHVGYHVEWSDNGWGRLIAPNGEQVGKASRDEAELLARIPGED